MATSTQDIISILVAFMHEHGGPDESWYVGLACDPRVALFEIHGVREETDHWLFKGAFTVYAARRVHDQIRSHLGTDGSPIGSGDHDATHVYAYQKAPHTRP